MAFNIQSWGRISQSANNDVSVLQDGSRIGAPSIYTYTTSTDTQAVIAVLDYFASQAVTLNVGDMIYAVDSANAVAVYSVSAITVSPPSVTIVQSVAVGDVDGPAASTDNALVRFDGVTGKLIQNGVILESDLGDLTLVRTIENAAGTIALPSYTFTGDTDTGMWHSAANTIDWSTNALRAFQMLPSPALSVNWIGVIGAIATTFPAFRALGTDANIDVQVEPKGTGALGVRGATNAGAVRLWNQANTFWTLHQSGAVGSNQSYTWPTALPLVNGQVLSGTTAGVLSWVSNGMDSWTDQTATPVAMVAGSQYSANTAGLLTFNVPAVAAFGDTFEIAGQGAGGWLVQMNAGQTANLNGSPTSVAGSLASTNRYNCIKLLCTVANTTFTVVNVNGVITVA